MSQNKEISRDGSFKRQRTLFTTPFGNRQGDLPVEKNRYRLIWAAPCPWSHRAVIVRKLLGLEEVISLGEVAPIRPDVPRIDWDFSLDENGIDPVLGIQYLSEIYHQTDPQYNGRPTVPVVIDLHQKKVVNNDYFNLTTYFETEWASFHKEGAPDLYPEHLRTEIDRWNDLIYDDINNGVYRCGFAQSQQAYEQAYDALFHRLDKLEEHLARNRFLLGDYITEADVRLYVTLARFDVAYYTVFKANKRRLIDYPNLWGYARDLYHTSGFGETTNFEAIKVHYYLSARLSPATEKQEIIIPKGPDISIWEEEPDRENLSGKTEKFIIS